MSYLVLTIHTPFPNTFFMFQPDDKKEFAHIRIELVYYFKVERISKLTLETLLYVGTEDLYLFEKRPAGGQQ